jgi:sodium transport system ATP-binding protein
MLRTEALRKVFHPPRGKEVVAVQGATFSVDAGEVFGLLGPNGAGKTTLLRMLGTIITPTSGHSWVGDVRSDEAKDEIRRHIGFLSGNTKLYGRLTAAETLRYFGRLYGMTEGAISTRTNELAEMLDMTDFLNRRCEGLSTGQAQKVSIARVILHQPKVLILDEPTAGLDIITSRSILDFILDAKAQGHCIIFSTHYMTEAEQLCDRVGLLHRGELMAVGTQAALFEETGKDNIHDAFLRLVDRRDQESAGGIRP